MSDRYLWDGTGEPDPEIVRLEQALAPLRLAAAPPVRRRTRRWQAPALAAGAALAAAAVIALWWRSEPRSPPEVAGAGETATATAPAPGPSPVAVSPPWLVAPLAGAPRVAGGALRAPGSVASGAVVETDQRSRARISMGDIGQVELERDTRVRLVAAGADRHQLGLERGVLHALIWAPAGRFQVQTAAGVVTDLGCAYTLSVDDRGRGLVTVSSGWVGFEYQGRESLIPAGATATLIEGHGPGTPLLADSPRPLRALVMAVDGDVAAPAPPSSPQLSRALAAARARDAVTLWHLLGRVPPGQRGLIHDRLLALAPPPPGIITRAGIVAGDVGMRDRWWDILGHGPIADWRRWKASGPPVAPVAPTAAGP